MKCFNIAAGLLFALFLCHTACAQETEHTGLFGKVNKLLLKSDVNAWKPGTAVTTSIKDSLPALRWLDDRDFNLEEADTIGSFNLLPGYYQATIRSYCLHAGTYSPTKGSGYQVAELKGSRSALISAILNRSAEHPEINQPDVQILLWGIEAGTRFSDYPADFRMRVQPLLTEKEMALMEVKVNAIMDKLVPGTWKEYAQTYQSLRNKMNASQMQYDELEQIAVKTGIPPTGLGSCEIDPGLWSYIGQGFYLRVYPQSYPTSKIELYRPGSLAVKRDALQRIVSFSRGGNRIDIEYNDNPAWAVLKTEGHAAIPIWRMKRIIFRGKEPGQLLEIDNKGWLFSDQVTQLEAYFTGNATVTLDEPKPTLVSGGPLVATTFELHLQQPATDITYQEAYDKFKEYKQTYDNLKETKKWYDRANDADQVKSPDEYLNEAAANKQVADAIKAASNPVNVKNKASWIYDLLKMNRDLAYYINCRLAGSCEDSNTPQRPDLPSKTAQPGNSASQRLGLSNFIK